MCDTFVALANSTKDGRVLFAKNSDREPNEAHELVIIPHMKHTSDEMVKCTYIKIPQVKETFQVLLAKPFWIWGAEMGANEFGVAIGNEALFTRDPYGKEPGLIGMDFLRLALERTKTAHEALLCIIDLLEKYGQSGNCGFAHPMFYHNSFLITDPTEAWVLETSAKEWAALKVRDVYSISNAITIQNEWDLASANLVAHAIEKGWCKSPTDFNFSRCYSEPLYTRFSEAHRRQSCTTQQLMGKKGQIDAALMMSILRNHYVNANDQWSPDRGITGADVCMHAGWGPIRGSQSTGSMVSQLDRNNTIHWLTGTSAPCTSLFKPVWMDSGIPDCGPSPVGKYDGKSLFWRHEKLHRLILEDYAVRIKVIKDEQLNTEKTMLDEVIRNLKVSVNQRREISEKYFTLSDELEEKWFQQIKSLKGKHKNHFLYRNAWRKFNREGELIVS